MEKRTTIYLDDDDHRAIETIRTDHEERGVKITASAAIRYALRETARRLGRRPRAGERDQSG